jgi:hypothetical protein
MRASKASLIGDEAIEMTFSIPYRTAFFSLSICFGCGDGHDAKSPSASIRRQPEARRPAPRDEKAEQDAIKRADISVLYFGNSHTGFHDIPLLVGKMITFRHPQTKYESRFLPCGFLEDAANNPNSKIEIEKHPWKFVVLQAQKISMSGKYKYSQKEGIDLAKAAKNRGADVLFFSEWGRRDVPKDGVVQESIYREMADAAGARVAPVGRAWDIALAEQRSLDMYNSDGNHESITGAFLTAAVFYGLFTDSDPAELAGFEHFELSKADRVVMANAASKVWKDERQNNATPSKK